MASAARINAERKAAGLPLVRFHIRRLQAEDIQDLRAAYAALYEISETAVGDNRGYAALARGHGYDQDLCHTNENYFLTWHRAYLYFFEKALASALRWKRNDPTLELTLPYWDWTYTDATLDAANGLPRVLDDASYVDANGATQKNPLASGPSLYRTVSQGLTGNDAFTVRYPSQFLDAIPSLKDEVARYMDNPSFIDFSNDFNFGAHGAVHVFVGGGDASSVLPGNGGDMSAVVSAAYDPIFWLHHAMVDKVWYDWQKAHPSANVPQEVLDAVVYGGMAGSTLIDAEESLLYIYSENDVQSAAVDPYVVSMPQAGSTVETTQQPSLIQLDIGSVQLPFRRAELDFHQLHPPKDSYELRAFIDKPDVDATTPRSDPAYAGRMVLFGHGRCHGAPGHCDPKQNPRDDYDQRPKHPLRFEHTRYVMDVTRGLRRYLTNRSETTPIKLYLAVYDGQGKLVPTNAVSYRAVSLKTYV